MAARRQKIEDFEVACDSSLTLEEIKDLEPKKREAGVKINEEEPEDSVAKAIAIMKEQKVL